mmetsp:Transcript_62045/g.110536  ORF Transcript_62045/g.110536 Transcript_62045/m.110536 type:complete len:304 (-) Transcript_62045:186-1097(-)
MLLISVRPQISGRLLRLNCCWQRSTTGPSMSRMCTKPRNLPWLVTTGIDSAPLAFMNLRAVVMGTSCCKAYIFMGSTSPSWHSFMSPGRTLVLIISFMSCRGRARSKWTDEDRFRSGLGRIRRASVDSDSHCVIHGCCRACSAVSRLFTSRTIHWEMKLLAWSEMRPQTDVGLNTYSHLRALIIISSSEEALKGSRPLRSLYVSAPTDHMSHAWPYPVHFPIQQRMISGAMYSTVPQQSVRALSPRGQYWAKPKSTSVTLQSCSRCMAVRAPETVCSEISEVSSRSITFSGLMSRCTIPLPCM